MIENIKERFRELRLSFRKPTYTGKVFCIGYNKTGTTTLGKSFEMPGYRNSSYNRKVYHQYYKNNQIDKVLDYAARFDSLDDLPWLKQDMIPVLDKAFPNSKFIYLTRDEEAWKKSLYNWRSQLSGKEPDIEKSMQRYRWHRDFVMDYFRDRPTSEFLILDVKDEKGFKKPATFLGKETDREGFPHFNKTKVVRKDNAA